MKDRIIIIGAAGRDFHNFNMLYREDPGVTVVAFTAAQIPFIDQRTYPPQLAGPLYPDGIPIFSEDRLPELIKTYKANKAVFSYSDVTFEHVMRLAALCTANNVDFLLPGAEQTMLSSSKPVISVCAVRTGCGKSGITRYIAGTIKEAGRKAVAIRHPMPYGDLAKQRLQRFSSHADVISANCTIEEMEEYEPLISSGTTVYAGVDYRDILQEAEKEADVILWDGGNNDLPFIKPDLEIVVTDALRPGHELGYYPGEENLRRAGLVIINKANAADIKDITRIRENIASVNPAAKIITLASVVRIDTDIRGKKVLAIEDGPTLTHGGMSYGAGVDAAKSGGAALIDPRPYAAGSIKDVFRRYPHIQNLLPAMGYSSAQIKELEETINATPCDLVVLATPVDLTRIMHIAKPIARVSYSAVEIDAPGLTSQIKDFLERHP